jgi:hypothetical protein
MKKVISTLLVLGLAVVFAGVLACGGGDDGKEDTTPAGDVQTQDNQTPDVPDKDTKVPDVPADVPAGDVPAEDAPAKDVPVEDVVPGAACVNAADDPLLDTEEERDEVKAVAQSCGIGCLAHPDVTGCASKCMNDQTGLSVGCSACYVDIIL